jgi:hypothetical protein
MNRGEMAKSLAKKWAAKIGPENARLRLVNLVDREGKPLVGFSTADKIARGVYEPTPGHQITEALFDEMAKDGFSLADEAS